MRGEGVNVLKPYLRTTIQTLLDNGATQREIKRMTGVDRKTIRRYQRQSNSPNLWGQVLQYSIGLV